jgi:hypothetical protein
LENFEKFCGLQNKNDRALSADIVARRWTKVPCPAVTAVSTEAPANVPVMHLKRSSMVIDTEDGIAVYAAGACGLFMYA